MMPRFVIAATLLLALSLPPLSAAATQSTNSKQEMNFVAQMRSMGYTKIIYLDLEGHPVDYTHFMAQASGKSFSMRKDSASQTVTLQPGKRVPSLQFSIPAQLQLKTGQSLPAAQLSLLPVLYNASFDTQQLVGHYTLISTFFADCIPCIAEVPMLNAYAQRHPEVHVVAVTFDDANTAEGFVAKHHLQWPVAFNAHQWLDEVGVKSYPTLMLVDPQGRLVATTTGGTTGAETKTELQASVDALSNWVRQAQHHS